MSKGIIAIQTVLSTVLVIMFVIAAALIIHLLFPYLGNKSACMGGQRLNIEEIDSYSKDAKTYGTEYIVKFRVEDCVECMWYHKDDQNQLYQLKIRWATMSTTDKAVIMNVSAPWNGIGTNDDDDMKCISSSTEIKNLKGNEVVVLDINYNEVKIQTTG